MNSIQHTPLITKSRTPTPLTSQLPSNLSFSPTSGPKYQRCLSAAKTFNRAHYSPQELTPDEYADITLVSAEYVLALAAVTNATHTKMSPSTTSAEELEINTATGCLFTVTVGKTAPPSVVFPASKMSAEEERINAHADYLLEIAAGDKLQLTIDSTCAEESFINAQADYLLAVAAGETAPPSTLLPSLAPDAVNDRISAAADYLLEIAAGVTPVGVFAAPALRARPKRMAADVALQRIVRRRR